MLAFASIVLFAVPAVAQEPKPFASRSTFTAQAVDAAAEAAAEASAEAADQLDDPSPPDVDADAELPPADERAEDPADGVDSAADDAAPTPARPSRSSALAKGIDGGAIVVKARTTVTQRLLAPARRGGKAKVLGSANRTARRAGTIRLTVKLNAAGRVFVEAGATKLTLKTMVDPAKGRTRTTTRTITIAAGS